MTTKLFKSSEEAISMVLGLVIVVLIVGLTFNFLRKGTGNVNVPGVSTVKEENTNKDKEEENIYTVGVRDNLWKISEKVYGSGYNWVDIASKNNLKNPGLLAVGQKLILPKIEKKEESTVSVDKAVIQENKEYTVLKGDNLWKISVKNYGDGFQWTKVWQFNKNKLINPDKLEIGMKLVLPKI